MFYDEFIKLCNRAGKTPTTVAKEIGLAGAHVTKWKNGSTPTDANVFKVCDYFGVSHDYFSAKEKGPALTEQDERDVARDVERIMENLQGGGELMFDGIPMSEEAKAAMAAAMRIGLEEAKRRNKETYTPKKFRKE